MRNLEEGSRVFGISEISPERLEYGKLVSNSLKLGFSKLNYVFRVALHRIEILRSILEQT